MSMQAIFIGVLSGLGFFLAERVFLAIYRAVKKAVRRSKGGDEPITVKNLPTCEEIPLRSGPLGMWEAIDGRGGPFIAEYRDAKSTKFGFYDVPTDSFIIWSDDPEAILGEEARVTAEDTLYAEHYADIHHIPYDPFQAKVNAITRLRIVPGPIFRERFQEARVARVISTLNSPARSPATLVYDHDPAPFEGELLEIDMENRLDSNGPQG